MLRGNAAEVRPADFDMWDCPNNLAAAIPALAGSATVDFPQLAEIHVLPEVFPHPANVGVVLVARDLVAAFGAGFENTWRP